MTPEVPAVYFSHTVSYSVRTVDKITVHGKTTYICDAPELEDDIAYKQAMQHANRTLGHWNINPYSLRYEVTGTGVMTEKEYQAMFPD